MTDHPLLLGDRYELGDVLGRGGMAEVRRARDTRLNRDVAIKTLRVDLAGDPTFQARFRREAQAAAGLNHPNIVSVYDTGVSLDRSSGVEIPYIVMELVDGNTLREILRDGRRILPERALELTMGALDALAYSHRHGIVHRDIKPANVMLTKTGQVKVMDFGIARAVSDTQATMTQTAAVIGTAQYLSPEQARGETVDARSDVYSAGCLLYELLTGRPPFIGDSPVSVAYQHVRETPLAPSFVDEDPMLTPEMDAVVLKALAKSPEERYQSAREMRDDIARLLSGQPIIGQIPAGFLPGGTGAETQVLGATQVIQPGAQLSDTGTLPVTTTPTRSVERRNPGIPILIGILILAGLGAIIFGIWALTDSTKPKDDGMVAVPSVVGMSAEAATKTLEDKKFSVKTVQQKSNDEATKGKVMSQNPTAETKAAPNSEVTITVNVGPESKAIPDLRGRSSTDAIAALKALGFSASTEEVAPDKEPKDLKQDQVAFTRPAAGTSADAGTTVTIYIATGKLIMPKVTQMDEAAAIQTLREAGFTNIAPVRHLQTNQGTAGTIFDQTPAPSERVSKSTPIILTVADAPPTPTATSSTPATSPTPSTRSPLPSSPSTTR